VGTERGWLSRFQDGVLRPLGPQPPGMETVFALAEGDGGEIMIVGGEFGLMGYRNGGSPRTERRNRACAHPGGDRAYWFSDEDGRLYSATPVPGRPNLLRAELKADLDTVVNCLAEGRDGTIWIGR